MQSWEDGREWTIGVMTYPVHEHRPCRCPCVTRYSPRERQREFSSAHRANKKDVHGIHGTHGTLFYELGFKKEFYPTKREAEMTVGLL